MANDFGEAEKGENRIGRLTANWVYGALPMAVLLILFAPFVEGVALPVYLALPIYMLHQYEEHDADRFRTSINLLLGPKARGLSHASVWIFAVQPASLAQYLAGAILIIALHAAIAFRATRPAR